MFSTLLLTGVIAGASKSQIVANASIVEAGDSLDTITRVIITSVSTSTNDDDILTSTARFRNRASVWISETDDTATGSFIVFDPVVLNHYMTAPVVLSHTRSTQTLSSTVTSQALSTIVNDPVLIAQTVNYTLTNKR